MALTKKQKKVILGVGGGVAVVGLLLWASKAMAGSSEEPAPAGDGTYRPQVYQAFRQSMGQQQLEQLQQAVAQHGGSVAQAFGKKGEKIDKSHLAGLAFGAPPQRPWRTSAPRRGPRMVTAGALWSSL